MKCARGRTCPYLSFLSIIEGIWQLREYKDECGWMVIIHEEVGCNDDQILGKRKRIVWLTQHCSRNQFTCLLWTAWERTTLIPKLLTVFIRNGVLQLGLVNMRHNLYLKTVGRRAVLWSHSTESSMPRSIEPRETSSTLQHHHVKVCEARSPTKAKENLLTVKEKVMK